MAEFLETFYLLPLHFLRARRAPGVYDGHELRMGTTDTTTTGGRKSRFGKSLAIIALPILLVAGGVLACNLFVIYSSRAKVFRDVSELSRNDVGLVLGTSKKVAPNRPNLHFQNRLKAAALLFREGKVKHLLVSGDNASSKYYNEPRDMKEALVALGVPAEAITGDPDGIRTLDSIVRAEKIFGLKKFTIISDDFHVPRAIFLAQSQGLDAVALASEEVSRGVSFKARSREWLARVRAVLDVYVLRAEPATLGDPVVIQIDQTGTDS